MRSLSAVIAHGQNEAITPNATAHMPLSTASPLLLQGWAHGCA